MSSREYSVKELLATRALPNEPQSRLDPASDMPPSALAPDDVYDRWRTPGGGLGDDAQVELAFGLFTDEVMRPYGGPLMFEQRPAWVVFHTYSVDRWPGKGIRRGWTDPRGLRYRVESAVVYDAETGEHLTGSTRAEALE